MFGHGAGSDPQVHHIDSEELYEMTESFKNCVIAPNQEMSHSLAAPLNEVRDMLAKVVNEMMASMKERGYHLQFLLLYPNLGL